MKVDLRKIYRFEAVEHPAGTPLPTGGNVFYECSSCNVVVSSVPFTPAKCNCGNLEGNKGKVEIREPDKVKVVHGKLK